MATEDTRSAVQGFKAMQRGEKKESRQERLARERREGAGKSQGDGPISREERQRVLRESQEAMENQEDVGHNLTQVWKQKVKSDKQKKKIKLKTELAMLKLCEITENGGTILECREAGFSVYEIVFTD